MKITYFNQGVSYKLNFKRQIKSVANSIFASEGGTDGDITIVFCSDEVLVEKNKQYLQKSYLTDIITFEDYDYNGKLMSDIFISLDRVSDNASRYHKTFENELCRVIIHGMLHLCGYADATSIQKRKMRALENKYLEIIEKLFHVEHKK